MLRAFGIRVRLIGTESLDPAHTYLYLSNHVSWLDSLIAVAVIPDFLIGLEKVENFRLPLYGAALREWGNIPIDRADHESAVKSCQAVAERLKEGTAVMLFPEGTRTRDGKLGTFKRGPFHVALDAGAVVVPVVFADLFEISRKGRFLVRPGTVEMRFGREIDCVSFPKNGVDRLASEVRQQMEKLLAADRVTERGR